MSDRKSSRLILPGLIVVTLIAASAVYFLRPSESVASQALDKAQSANKLQSLAELDGKAPTNRKLDVQTWTTAEGAKVLFVEADVRHAHPVRRRQQPGRQRAGPGADDQRHAQRRRTG
jgi:zinc protease